MFYDGGQIEKVGFLMRFKGNVVAAGQMTAFV